MTAYTSSGSGLASSSATWGGAGHPSTNGDTFSIGSGHVIDWDLDLTGLTTGLGASVCNGTMQAHRAAGTYGFKLNGNLTGTGVIDASNGSGGAYVGGQTFQIVLNTTSVSISVSGAQNIICLEPTYKYVKLTQNESATATTLHVDTDLTGEPTYWKTGDLVRVDDINQAAESEQYSISSVTSTTVVLSSGLTNAKSLGAYVILVSRNVKVIGAGTGGGTGFSSPGTGSIIGAEIRSIATGISGTINPTVSGTITNIANGVTSTLQGAFSCSISGASSNGFNQGRGYTVTGLVSGCGIGIVSAFAVNLLNAILSGCGTGISGGSVIRSFGAMISGCGTGISAGAGMELRNVTLTNNTFDVNSTQTLESWASLFGSTSEYVNYNGTARAVNDYAESFDHDQVAGAYRNWCKGGITSSNTGTVYGSRARSYQHALESAAAYSFRDQLVLVPAGGSLLATCYIQKDASMSYLPRVQIFDAAKEPLLSGSADAETPMTNSTGTWEVLEAKVTNTGSAPKLYKARVIASNASGNVYEDTDIRVSGLLDASLSEAAA